MDIKDFLLYQNEVDEALGYLSSEGFAVNAQRECNQWKAEIRDISYGPLITFLEKYKNGDFVKKANHIRELPVDKQLDLIFQQLDRINDRLKDR